MRTLRFACLFAVLLLDSMAALELLSSPKLQMGRETRIELATKLYAEAQEGPGVRLTLTMRVR
jgi:hypothetical protein